MLRDYDAFISYTRQQGAPLAQRVLDLLNDEHFKVWLDRSHMRGGEDFWRQIETAIERARYLIMVLTQDAFEGDRQVLRNEWLTARRRGCAVLPVFDGDSLVNFSSPTVPAWLNKLDCYNLDDTNHRTKLVNDLRTTPEYRPIPHNVDFPAHFVRREEEMAAVLSALTSPSGGGRMGITTALRGAGGFGKTTLAKALCFEDSVLARYTDGVLWLTVGEGERSPANLLTTLLQLLGQTPQSIDEDVLFGQWREALRTRTCLIVLDDVWRESDALALVVRETASAYLITTRIPRVATAVDALDCLVNEMLANQALAILGFPLGERAGQFEDRLRVLADKAGYWSFLLGLIASQIRYLLSMPGATTEQALAMVEEDLSDLGLTAFDRQDSQKRDEAVARTIAASLKYLSQSRPDCQVDTRYRELAVFPDDEPLEIAVLQDLWGLSRVEARRLAEAFYSAGLATLNLSQGLSLHDVFLAYLRSLWDPPDLRALHQRFLEHWPDRNQLPHLYAWRWYGWHCLQAGEPELLAAALLDLQWLSARLAHSDLSSLLADCRRAQEGVPHQQRSFLELREALELSAHILLQAPEQLAAQLYGRLRSGLSPEIDPLIQQAEKFLATQSLRPLTQNLRPVGSPLKRTLRGHEASIYGVLELSDGRLLSWSLEDMTLRLWGTDGQTLAVLRDHESYVNGATELSDGRLLSWSVDKTLRLWAADGQALAVLSGHENSVDGVRELSDGRLLSWSYDKTLRLWVIDDQAPVVLPVLSVYDPQWKWEMGDQALTVLRGHEDAVNSATELSDGRLLSWSEDQTLRLWTADGQALAVLHGHEGPVAGALILSDGRLLSWSKDKTLRLWATGGQTLTVLSGHEDAVFGATELSNGRLLSWSTDNTLRLWAADGQALAVLRGHEHRVNGAKELSDGRLLSWGDKTLRLWEADGQPLTVLRGHEHRVSGAKELSDGRLLSWGAKTLRLWAANGQALAVLRGHESFVHGVLMLSDVRLISWSSDMTLRLWVMDDSSLGVQAGHEDYINGLLELSDGRLLSWSEDKTLRLWGADGQALAVLSGHEGPVSCAKQLSDGRLLSCSRDNTLRLWALDGQLLTVLHNHEDAAFGATELSDGRLLSWGSGSLQLWTANGQPLTVLRGHEGSVHGAKELPNGQLLSWSADKTLRLWAADGSSLKIMSGHKDWVGGVEELSDHRLLSWSWVSNFDDRRHGTGDYTLRLWAADGEALKALTGHEGALSGVRELSNGRLLSWACDKTLRLWAADGQAVTVLSGHENDVEGARELSDGRLLSWSYDKTLRLWAADGQALAVLSDHVGPVNGATELSDSRLLSWSKDKTLRLWSSSGDPLAVLHFDAEITEVAKVPGISRLMIGDSLGGVHWVDVA